MQCQWVGGAAAAVLEDMGVGGRNLSLTSVSGQEKTDLAVGMVVDPFNSKQL